MCLANVVDFGVEGAGSHLLSTQITTINSLSIT